MKHQIITNKGKPSLVIIPYSDYLEFLELKRTHGLGTGKSRPVSTSGRKSAVPEEVSRRLQRGESPVKAWRLYRDLTQGTLGGRIGLSKSAISFIESGKRRGSPETLQALARELDVQVSALTSHGKVEK